MTVKEIAKFITALIGAAVAAAAAGLIPDSYAKWITVGVAFATAIGVYAVPNGPPASSVSPTTAKAVAVSTPVDTVAGPQPVMPPATPLTPLPVVQPAPPPPATSSRFEGPL